MQIEFRGGTSLRIAHAVETPQAVPSVPSTVGEWVRQQKWPLLATAAMVGFIYAPDFAKLFSVWRKDPHHSHGFIVPVAFAFVQLYAGRLGAEYFVAQTSLLTLLGGVALYLFGWKLLRHMLFPIGWLLLIVSLPAILFYAVTFPLQLILSQMASRFLDLLAVPNLREGNMLYLPHFTVGIVEACSGIGSLISLLAFAVLSDTCCGCGWSGGGCSRPWRCQLQCWLTPCA